MAANSSENLDQKSLLIRGKPRAHVKESLVRYCAEAGYRGAARLFILNDRGFGYAAAAVLWEKPFRLLRWPGLFAVGKITALRLPLPARTIRVKNNIRVFFNAAGQASKPKTAKVVVESRHRTGSLRREIEARLRLPNMEVGRFAAPRVIRYDTAEYTWLEEEFIESQPGVTEHDKVGIFLNEAAIPIYADYRQPQRVVEALAGMGLETENLRSLFGELHVDESLLQERWTASFIHGDLSPANMILGTDNRLYLIDWELSDFAPIAWDLKKLFPRDKEGVLNVIEALRHQGDIQSGQQMRLALVCELALLRRNGGLRFSYLTSNRNKSERAALKMMSLQEERLVNSIRELAKA